MIPCILVHAAYDPPTIFASECAVEARQVLNSAKFPVWELCGAQACKAEVHKHLKAVISQVRAFLNYGHGSEAALYGNNGELLLDLDSANLLHKKICYIISCSAAKEFGEHVVSKGGICFLGFNGDFEYSPLHEKVFKMCANSGIKAMIERKTTVVEAVRIMRETFDNMIQHYSGNDKESANWLMLISLLRDREYLVLLGDGSVSLWK